MRGRVIMGSLPISIRKHCCNSVCSADKIEKDLKDLCDLVHELTVRGLARPLPDELTVKAMRRVRQVRRRYNGET